MQQMNEYVALWQNKQAEIFAETLYAAKLQAIALWKVRKTQQHMVSVFLVVKADGTPVIHAAAELPGA
jgi:hypothetical protein